MYETDKEFLHDAAKVVDAMVTDNPDLGIPVDPELADFMGAFDEDAITDVDFDTDRGAYE